MYAATGALCVMILLAVLVPMTLGGPLLTKQ